MLSGRLPFDAPTFEALAAKHLGETHVPLHEVAPQAPRAMCEVIERALSKTRALRWRSGRELADALAAAAVPRRWFRVAAARTAALFRSRPGANGGFLGATLKTAPRWPRTP